MDDFYNDVLFKLEAAINELEFETEHSIQRIEDIICFIIKYLSQVKEFVLERGFNKSL